jgi:hypothetical protein
MITQGRPCDCERLRQVLRIADFDPCPWLDDNLSERKLSPWEIVGGGVNWLPPVVRNAAVGLRCDDPVMIFGCFRK